MPYNPNCDGSGPHKAGEVRVLPVSSIADHGNMILCQMCFNREIAWRKERNRELSQECWFALPAWESLKVYETS